MASDGITALNNPCRPHHHTTSMRVHTCSAVHAGLGGSAFYCHTHCCLTSCAEHMDNILQAIEEFLKSMKLTLQDMKQRPALSAAVVGYHGENLGWWGWLGPWHTPRQLEVGVDSCATAEGCSEAVNPVLTASCCQHVTSMKALCIAVALCVSLASNTH